MNIEINEKPIRFFRSLRGHNNDKFNRMVKLAAMFDDIDLKMWALSERGNFNTETARCALAVRLLLHTGIRVGNESSAEGYVTKPHPNSKAEPTFVRTYGLTTLTSEHITIRRNAVYLNFLGKRQVENSLILTGNLAKHVKLLQVTEGTLLNVTAPMLAKFIRRYVGKQFTPKDFRTLRANIEAYNMVEQICKRSTPTTKRQFNAEVREITEHVASCLSNTPGVCKASYIDDLLFEYLAEKRWGK